MDGVFTGINPAEISLLPDGSIKYSNEKLKDAIDQAPIDGGVQAYSDNYNDCTNGGTCGGSNLNCHNTGDCTNANNLGQCDTKQVGIDPV